MRQWSRAWMFFLGASTLAVTACDGGGAPPRGFGSRQLLASRDPTLQYLGQGTSNNDFFYSTGSGPDGLPTHYWLLSMASGESRDLGPIFPVDLVAPPADQRFQCTTVYAPPAGTALAITDTQSGQQTLIEDFYALSPGCPSEDQPDIVVWRADAAGNLTLWTGRYDALVAVPLDLAVRGLVNYDQRAAAVVASPPAQPDVLGIFSIDIATAAITEVVSPAMGPADWAAGAVPAGALASATLRLPHAFDDVELLYDHYTYPRTMSDGGATMFTGPLGSASATRELALFHIDGAIERIFASGSAFSRPAADGGLPPDSLRVAWQEHDAAQARDLILVWDDLQRRLISCVLPPSPRLTGVGYYSGGALQMAFTVDNLNPNNTSPTGGPLLLVFPERAGQGDGKNACVLVAAEDIVSAGFSRDGAAMFWLVAPAAGDAALWTAAGDGSGARLIGSGVIASPQFLTNTEIAFTLGDDLVSVDLRDDPVRVHSIVEHVFYGGPLELLGGSWLVEGYEQSQQDGTGKLGLVNHDTGEKRLISNSVVWYYRVSVDAPDGGMPPRGVLYLVRGRNPSSQDGLWLATITADDLLE